MSTPTDSLPALSSPEAAGAIRLAWLFYPLWLSMPVICVSLGLHTGHAAWFWATPAFLFIGIPILDKIFGSSSRNPAEAGVPGLEATPYYRRLTYVCVALHYLALLFGAWAVATQSPDVLAYAGIALSCGLISAFGIVTAHELGHKKGGLERWLAKITLATGVYGQYMTDHNCGHHREIATPEDSGSARFGENLFYYLIMRQIPHSTCTRPWRLEKARLARQGKSAWSLGNQVLQPTLISVGVYGVLVAVFGMAVIPYLLAVAFTSYFFLGFTDYVEHYGLLREKRPDGRYAQVRPEHSWNTDHIVTNILYLHAQRHSDHHAHPTRRYQALRSFPNLPTLPSGYPGMFWLSIIPPLWRAVMDPRLLKRHGHDLNRINVDPRRRDALFAKYSRFPDRSKTPAAVGPEVRIPESPTARSPATSEPRTYQCPSCGYFYREAAGDPAQGFPPGTRWTRIPATWACPDCAVRDKTDFVEIPPASPEAPARDKTAPMQACR